MASPSDLNLVFGMIALQCDFISKEQLFAGMQAWIFDKSKSLGELLVAQNALDADTRLLLESLVKKHLAQHGGDPQRSLAALSSRPSADELLRRLPDSDLLATIDRVRESRDMSVANAAVSPNPDSTVAPPDAGVRFRILRPHAKGGLGVVYVAHDKEINRQVALKEIQLHRAGEENARARFLLEAEITGGLEHPGIVPIYGLGHYADGRPYYAMRFIKGDSLHDAVKSFHATQFKNAVDRDMALKQLLRRFIDVCNAIEYAHSKGVLHRDLKPANVMLGKYGETLVVDWGLAKATGKASPETSPSLAEPPVQPASANSSDPTMMGSAIGTPAYMSPEQAAGRVDLLSTASDVYSLGATLYHVLTGRPPIVGDNMEAILADVRSGTFPPPRSVNSKIDAGLEAICLKAMSLDPASRYASAAELRMDVENWIDDAPLAARRDPLTVKARRFVARHRLAATGLAAALVVAIGFLGVLSYVTGVARDRIAELASHEADAKNKAQKEALAAENARDRASRGERDARRNLYLAQMGQAHLAWKDGQVGRVADLVELQRPKNDIDDFRDFEWHYLNRLVRTDHSIAVRLSLPAIGMAYREDGGLLAVATSAPASVAPGGLAVDTGPPSLDEPGEPTLSLHDSATGKLLRTLKGYVGGVSSSLAFSPDGKSLAARAKNAIGVWDVTTGAPRLTLPIKGHIFGAGITFSPNGELLAATEGKSVRIWDASTGREVDPAIKPHGAYLKCLAFSHNGEQLIAGSMSGGFLPQPTIVAWEIKTGKQVLTLQDAGGTTALAVSPDGKTIASAGGDFQVRLWDTTSKKQKFALRGHTNLVAAVQFADAGRRIITGSHDGTLRVWNTSTGAIERTLRRDTLAITGLALSKDERVWSSCGDGTVRSWAWNQDQEHRTFVEPRGPACSLAFHPDGRHLACGSKGVTVWNLETGKAARLIGLVGSTNMGTLAISPDGTRVAAGNYVRAWDFFSGEKVFGADVLFGRFPDDREIVSSLVYSHDGNLLASVGPTGAQVRDAASGKRVWREPEVDQKGAPAGVAYSSDAKWLATGNGKEVKLWNAATYEKMLTLPSPDTVMAVSFASKDRLMAVSNTFALAWEVPSGREVFRFRLTGSNMPTSQNLAGPHRAAFSADHRRLAFAPLGTNTVAVWDVASGQQVLSLPGPRLQVIVALAFSQDGYWLAAAGIDETSEGIVHLWDARPVKGD